MISKLKYAVAVLLALPFLMLSTSCSKNEMDKFLDGMEDVCDILEDVDDKESADKAAEKLKIVAEKMNKCKAEFIKKLDAGEISMEEWQKYVLKTMQPGQAKENELQRLRMKNFYDSEKLRSALYEIPTP